MARYTLKNMLGIKQNLQKLFLSIPRIIKMIPVSLQRTNDRLEEMRSSIKSGPKCVTWFIWQWMRVTNRVSAKGKHRVDKVTRHVYTGQIKIEYLPVKSHSTKSTLIPESKNNRLDRLLDAPATMNDDRNCQGKGGVGWLYYLCNKDRDRDPRLQETGTETLIIPPW